MRCRGTAATTWAATGWGLCCGASRTLERHGRAAERHGCCKAPKGAASLQTMQPCLTKLLPAVHATLAAFHTGLAGKQQGDPQHSTRQVPPTRLQAAHKHKGIARMRELIAWVPEPISSSSVHLPASAADRNVLRAKVPQHRLLAAASCRQHTDRTHPAMVAPHPTQAQPLQSSKAPGGCLPHAQCRA